MTIQTDLRTVTDRIIVARKTLADREFTRMAFARNARQAKTALDSAMVTSMARSEAGSNETARRAFATYETTAERRAVKAADDALTEAEAAVLDATVALRSLEDERRYLEIIVRLAIANLDNLTVIDDSDNADAGKRRRPWEEHDARTDYVSGHHHLGHRPSAVLWMGRLLGTGQVARPIAIPPAA